jgi:hypothetical protein
MEQTFAITKDGCRRLGSTEPTEPVHIVLEAAHA